eukprot:4405284-Pyramimonas_sp.AAC.1
MCRELLARLLHHIIAYSNTPASANILITSRRPDIVVAHTSRGFLGESSPARRSLTHSLTLASALANH